MSVPQDDSDFDPGELVERLRREAGGLRDCFTQFSFKGMALAAAGLGLIFASAESFEFVDLAAVPLIWLLATITRIGIYKYASSNRVLGYELHLYRTAGVSDREGGWNRRYQELDWEAALRAWRVVQPALFRRIYKTPEEFPRNRWLRRVLRTPPMRWLHDRSPFLYSWTPYAKKAIRRYLPGSEAKEYPWFHLPTLTRPSRKLPATAAPSPTPGDDKSASRPTAPLYHAGSYLHHMLRILVLMQLLLLTPIVLVAWGEYKDRHQTGLWLRLALLVMLVIMIGISAINLSKRRRMIESGLLSIHSTAITWQAVVLAHYRAIGDSPGKPTDYLHYTENLLQQALTLARAPLRIHQWVAGGPAGGGSPAVEI